MIVSAGICRSAGASSCLERPLASAWGFLCLWGRSTRGSRREGQRYALCLRWGADVTRALEGKPQGRVQHGWDPSLHGNRANIAVSAMTVVRSAVRKRHDDDDSAP